MKLDKILTQAQKAKYGISLMFDNVKSVKQMRRRIYAYREKLRATGCNDFDGLSCLIRNDVELWILKRNALPKNDCAPIFHIREINAREAPQNVNNRGKSRPSLHIP